MLNRLDMVQDRSEHRPNSTLVAVVIDLRDDVEAVKEFHLAAGECMD